MIPVTTFAGKTVAVFGLGGSGLATCRALREGGADIIACDDNSSSMAVAAAEGFVTQDLREADWSRIAALVLAPGVPLTHPAPHWTVQAAQAANVEVIGDIELFCRERKALAPYAPFIAITGTNGKSTTTALIAHLLREAGHDVQIGGNIGTAILSLDPPAPGRCHVVEMSSYQIDLAPSLHPSIGILINVSEDHLDRHGTIEHYAAVKERLVAGVLKEGAALIGVDDVWCRSAADRVEADGGHVVRVSVNTALDYGIFVEGTKINKSTSDGRRVLADLTGIGSLRGTHNAQNAAFALGAAIAMGLSPEEVQQGLRSFPGLAHRMEQVGRIGPTLFVNDSKGTNTDATAKALASFNDIYWIAGGKPKTGGIASLAEFFPRVKKAYLIGEAAAEFAATLEGKVPYEISGTIDVAVASAARDAGDAAITDGVVLLSPACASFDQFRNFEIRGDHFRQQVQALPGIEKIG